MIVPFIPNKDYQPFFKSKLNGKLFEYLDEVKQVNMDNLCLQLTFLIEVHDINL